MKEPNGLLAIGGDLSARRLLHAYRHGIFPWFMPGEPVLWWSPDPRCVFRPACVHLPRRLQRWLSTCRWQIRADVDFDAVINACAAPRRQGAGTWITAEVLAAFVELHRLGRAHSIEVYDEGRMVGGLYGLAVGRLFCAESMFSAETSGSKVALLALARTLAAWDWPLLDAQVPSPHLFTLGAELMPRKEFCAIAASLSTLDGGSSDWAYRFGAVDASELVQ
jgi:leucyl/phenylalanyl-tRNA--protein transferase